MNLLNLYFLSNWLPTIAASSGLSTTNAVLVGTALQAGGVLGTVLMGPVSIASASTVCWCRASWSPQSRSR